MSIQHEDTAYYSRLPIKRADVDRDEFLHILGELDRKLDDIGYNGRIEIKAIGGFAIMYRGLLDGRTTGDIDTITADYPREVEQCIEAVGVENHLGPCWINNDAVLTYEERVGESDVEEYISRTGAAFEKFEHGFSHIDIYVADLPTLIRSKADAVAMASLSTRGTKDINDLRGLLDADGVSSAGAAKEKYWYFSEPEYLPAVELLAGRYKGTGFSDFDDGLDDFGISSEIDMARDQSYYDFRDDAIDDIRTSFSRF